MKTEIVIIRVSKMEKIEAKKIAEKLNTSVSALYRDNFFLNTINRHVRLN